MAEITQKLVDGAGLQTAIGIMANYSDNMDRGVVGGYNQSFPLTAATKGNIYYHKPTNRYYICINNYSGSSLSNPNSNFEELSVYTNRQRLDNLVEFSKGTTHSGDTSTPGSISVDFYKLGHLVFVTGFVIFGKETSISDLIPSQYRPAKELTISCIVSGADLERAYAYSTVFRANGGVKIFEGQPNKIGMLAGVYSVV